MDPDTAALKQRIKDLEKSVKQRFHAQEKAALIAKQAADQAIQVALDRANETNAISARRWSIAIGIVSAALLAAAVIVSVIFH